MVKKLFLMAGNAQLENVMVEKPVAESLVPPESCFQVKA
jgi:hypothetical protein